MLFILSFLRYFLSYAIQVEFGIFVNKIESQKNDNVLKFGMVIIDIDSKSHNTLMEIIHQAKDENSYINNEVDLNELWEFFFESGFIYPQKYRFLQDLPFASQSDLILAKHQDIVLCYFGLF